MIYAKGRFRTHSLNKLITVAGAALDYNNRSNFSVVHHQSSRLTLEINRQLIIAGTLSKRA